MSYGEGTEAGTSVDEPSRLIDGALEEALSGDDAPAFEAAAADPADPDGSAGLSPGDPDDAGRDDQPDDAGRDDQPDAADDEAAEDDEDDEVTQADLEQEGEIAADYVEGLLDIADLDGDIDMDVEADRALVSVVGGTLDELIGGKGEVLEALQELTRLAVQRQTGERTRLMLDVGGYRARRRAELTEVGQDAAGEVKRSGVPKRLAAMTAFERKIVHDAVAAAGLRSESEGEDPGRRVVVFPA